MRAVCCELLQLSNIKKAPLSVDYQRVLRQLQPFMDDQRLAREPIVAELAFMSGEMGQDK